MFGSGEVNSQDFEARQSPQLTFATERESHPSSCQQPQKPQVKATKAQMSNLGRPTGKTPAPSISAPDQQSLKLLRKESIAMAFAKLLIPAGTGHRRHRHHHQRVGWGEADP